MSSSRDQRRGTSASMSSPGVLRLLLSPRWIAWHLLTLGAMVTCGLLAAWQWRRAGTALGSAVNVGYGLQWPVFAVFFAVVWWRLLRIEVRKVREASVAPSAPEPVAVEAPREPSPFAYRPGRAGPVDDAESPALAEYNRLLAALAAQDRELQEHDDRRGP